MNQPDKSPDTPETASWQRPEPTAVSPVPSSDDLSSAPTRLPKQQVTPTGGNQEPECLEEGPEAAEQIPERIDRYRILKVLGEGGFGVVYLAHDDDMKRLVAIKVPQAHRIAKPEDAEAYMVEAQILARLDHRHIVPVFDVGRSGDGLPFVVSKFIEGTNLATRINEARPSLKESAIWMAQIAEALQHAHQKGLVHRDVKPANILLDAAHKPFLGDFGLALKEEDFGKRAAAGVTPPYMSPEQANGEGH